MTPQTRNMQTRSTATMAKKTAAKLLCEGNYPDKVYPVRHL
jgi:hypothetical protein